MEQTRDELHRALRAAIRDGLASAPAEGADARWDAVGPRPWVAWLLLCLMRQIPRQRWLVQTVAERLPRQRGRGEVPGLTGWRYLFHGIGCCFEGPGREILDVDFYGDGGLTIVPSFFARRVLRLDAPALPEARLRALLPTEGTIEQAIEELQNEGVLLRPRDDASPCRLAEDLEMLANAAANAPFETLEERKRWARHLGDFEDLASLDEEWRHRAARAHQARIDWLRAVLAAGQYPQVALEPLAALLPESVFVHVVEEMLAGPIGPATGKALTLLDQIPGAQAADAVLRLLARLSPAEHHPYAAWAAAQWLLRRGVARDDAIATVLAFARVDKAKGYAGNPFRDALALLALEHAPEHALEPVRRALRDETPLTRHNIAAVLAVFDRPWCRRELAAALLEKHEQSGTAELRAALACSKDPITRALAERWSLEHPPSPRQGAGFTLGELLNQRDDAFSESTLEKAREWVASSGSRVPDDL